MGPGTQDPYSGCSLETRILMATGPRHEVYETFD